MPRFHFKLAALLRIRESTRDQRRVELAESQRTDAELHGRLTQLDEEQKQLQCERRKVAGPGQVDIARLVESQRYAATVRSQEIGLQEQRRTLAEEIERRRQALIEADRQVRMLETLREKQLEMHRQEADRQEAKRLDEAALQTAALGAF